MIFFGIYDNLTSEHVPGLPKYDVCMTEQVSGPQGTKIAGRHMVMIPYGNKSYEFVFRGDQNLKFPKM